MHSLSMLLLTVLLFFSPLGKANDDLTLLKNQIKKWHLSSTVDSLQLITLLDSLKDDGSWGDIDYATIQKGDWPLMEHLNRLYSLTVGLKKSESVLSNYALAEKKVMSAYAFWVENDFENSNWWHNVIGIQQVLGPITILLKDDLNSKLYKRGLEILKRPVIGMTGQNKVWLAGNVLYRALLEENVLLLSKAVEGIKSEIVISTGEGIQADFSFHQHGPQQQFGNYGLHFAEELVYWGTVLKNTTLQLDKEQLSVLRSFLYDGLRWVSVDDKFDISACGRQLAPDSPSKKNNTYKTLLERYSRIDPKAKMRSSVSEGNRYFWRSDYMMHRPASFDVSVKMSSNRVIGSEAGNGENLSGYHLGDGATYIYRNGNEYTNIFPFWDWQKLPGITSVMDTANLPVLTWSGYRNNADFVGGVSDGKNGIAAMKFNRDSLSALKSWFFFDDAVVCIGSGVNSNLALPVVTNVNQCFLKSKVTIADNEYIRTLGKGQHFFENLQWVVHDSIGYYFFYNQQVVIENESKSGNWSKVASYFSDDTLSDELFTMTIEHQESPSNGTYAYCIVPGVDRNTMENYFRYQLLESSSKLHAVKDSRNNSFGMVFFEKGGLMLSKDLGIGVTIPSIVQVKPMGADFMLLVSDPSCLNDKLTISLVGKYKAEGARSVIDAAKEETSVFVNLPDSAFRGSTVEIFLTKAEGQSSGK